MGDRYITSIKAGAARAMVSGGGISGQRVIKDEGEGQSRRRDEERLGVGTTGYPHSNRPQYLLNGNPVLSHMFFASYVHRW